MGAGVLVGMVHDGHQVAVEGGRRGHLCQGKGHGHGNQPFGWLPQRGHASERQHAVGGAMWFGAQQCVPKPTMPHLATKGRVTDTFFRIIFLNTKCGKIEFVIIYDKSGCKVNN